MKIAIIGAGPAGLWASCVCGMYKMHPIIIDSLNVLGGQCAKLYPNKNIYDIPGIPAITGQKLIDNLIKQSEPFQKEILLNNKVLYIKKLSNNEFQITTRNIQTNITNNIIVNGVIIATGAGAFEFKKAEFENAQICENKSLFYAVQNKEMFKDKTIVINGAGDSASDYVDQLSSIAKKIFLIHRRNTFRFSDFMLDKFMKLDNVEIVTPVTITTANHLDGKIYNVVLSNSKVIECEFVLCFFGLHNNISDIKSWNIHTANTKIIVDHNYSTSIEGIYAISDIAQQANYPMQKKLILHAFGEAYTAAFCLSQYLKLNTKIQYSTSLNYFNQKT